MNIIISPTLIEDIKQVVESFSRDNSWIIFGADDKTGNFKNIFSGFKDVDFNEIRDIYYYIELPHDLHVVLVDEYADIDFDLDDLIGKPNLENSFSKCKTLDPLIKQTINLYICESEPTIRNGTAELGMRIVRIKWSRLFRNNPFGISEIKFSVRDATLEDPHRLPLMFDVVKEICKIKTTTNEK
jgi:hypothetical protein